MAGARPRVLAIGLDGLELSLAERFMAEGEMPCLADLRHRAVTCRLDPGASQRTGLAWEHVASGLSPEAGRRWAAVEFDPDTYDAWQEGARFTPWWAGFDRRAVVFDAPYVDLERAPNTRGIVGWGAHDPGVSASGRPDDLLAGFRSKFGAYPASRWTYGLPFPSEARTREMGAAVSAALDLRAEAAVWLALEGVPDWELFLAVVGELHGTIEGLWHGIDATHPYHSHPAASAAGGAVLDAHRALDRMIGKLVAAAGDAAIVAFNMGGMGPNHSDVPSMVLLPELLYRYAFDRPLLTIPAEWTAAPERFPLLNEGESWAAANRSWFPAPAATPRALPLTALYALARRLPTPIRAPLKRALERTTKPAPPRRPGTRQDLHWQPAIRYRPHWRRMPAFALPSYYDGRIRLNVEGRESGGIVKPAEYEATCRHLEKILGECRNPWTGGPAVALVERAATRDPLALSGSEADLLVVWRDVTAALVHPRLGQIGPVPLRRTGGHTGSYGMAYVAAPGLEAADLGVRSAFDVVPTIAHLLGETPPPFVSGESFISH